MRDDRSTDRTYSGSEAAGSPARGPLRGRVCVVTGANRGIGKATATGLARLGATVIMLARDARLGAAARDDVQRDSQNPLVSLVTADLASLDSVRAAAAEISSRHPAVHVLVNNAGVNLARRAVSADGVEMTLAVNHLGPFVLTSELLPALRRGAAAGGARVVTVTSEFERFGRIAFGNLQGQRRYVGLLAYTQSKLANVLFTYELAARLAGTGVTANCVYPGLVATDLMRDRLWWSPRWLRALWGRVLLTPEEGARPSIHAASSPELQEVTGQCFDRRGRRVRTSRRSYGLAERERLWRASEELAAAGADERSRIERRLGSGAG
jgi:NAD(P)-dependent dehydrogenase (short-subunit alcohol dehydrogenase family)